MQVMIAGRTYPIKVEEKDIPSIRRVVEEINNKVKDFQLTYINKDRQDCLAMTLLTYAVELQDVKVADTSKDQINAKIDHLDKLIDSILS